MRFNVVRVRIDGAALAGAACVTLPKPLRAAHPSPIIGGAPGLAILSGLPVPAPARSS